MTTSLRTRTRRWWSDLAGTLRWYATWGVWNPPTLRLLARRPGARPWPLPIRAKDRKPVTR